MTSCPDTGLLRAALDGEADVPAHAGSCERCRAELEGLRTDAAVAAAALARLAPPDVEAEAQGSPSQRWGVGLGRVAAAAACLALVVVLVATPGGRGAAAAFLAAFRTERFAVVTVNPAQAQKAFA